MSLYSSILLVVLIISLAKIKEPNMNKIINLHVDHWHLVFDMEEEQAQEKTFDDYVEELFMQETEQYEAVTL